MRSNRFLVGVVIGYVIAVAGCDGRTSVGIEPPDDGGNPPTGGGDGGPQGQIAGDDAGPGPGTFIGNDAGPGSGGGDGPFGLPDDAVDTSGGGSCPQAGVNATPTTIDGMRASLSRTWILCSPLGLTHQSQAGLVITTDDRYALLERDASGALVVQHGVDFTGWLTYYSIQGGTMDGAVQTDFTSDLGLTVISRAVITANPTMLIINDEGVYEYRYVAAE